MKKLNLVKLIKKYKKTSFFIFCITTMYLYVQLSIFFYDTVFEIHNKTGKQISFSNFQYKHKNEDSFDFEDEDEYKSFKYYYDIKRNGKSKSFLNPKYHHEQNQVYVSIEIRYGGKYLTNNNIYERFHVNFSTKPIENHQKPSCSFKIEVYPDKTVVTPTYKRFCKKPMYNYENFNLYDI